MGYQNVRNYSDGWEGWSTNYIEDASYTAPEDLPGATDGWIRETSGRPVAYGVYPNGNLIVDGESLEGALEDSAQVILDVRSASDFANGHIEHAVNIPTSALDFGNTRDLDTPEVVAARFGAAGISNDTKVIIYGKGVDSNAGRVFWALEYLGANDVHVLDGGYDKWVAEGRETVMTVEPPMAATFVPSPDPTKFATTEDVLSHYADTTNYAIVDSRNASDYDMAHIPGAINILTGDFLNADGTVKSYFDLKTQLDDLGITLAKTVIAHCYVGYRSGQEYFVLRLMDFDVSNYEGSWTEWSADPSLPTEP